MAKKAKAKRYARTALGGGKKVVKRAKVRTVVSTARSY